MSSSHCAVHTNIRLAFCFPQNTVTDGRLKADMVCQSVANHVKPIPEGQSTPQNLISAQLCQQSASVTIHDGRVLLTGQGISQRGCYITSENREKREKREKMEKREKREKRGGLERVTHSPVYRMSERSFWA